MFGAEIWQKYLILKSECEVVRAGFGIYGIYPYTLGARSDWSRSESDLEHTAGMVILTMLMAMYHPEIVPPSEVALYMMAALLHEVGETEIGDIPDDGSRNEAEKITRERQVMMRFVSDLPGPYGSQLMDALIEFQDLTTRRGRVLYCLDKVETLLQGLRYERDGRGGDARNKEAMMRLSAQDQRGIERSQSTRLVDVWTAHYLDKTAVMPEARVFNELLKAAVIEVRGEWFSWAQDN